MKDGDVAGLNAVSDGLQRLGEAPAFRDKSRLLTAG